MDGSKLTGQKVLFSAILAYFGEIFSLERASGDNYFQTSENVTFLHYEVVTQCKISENTMDSH